MSEVKCKCAICGEDEYWCGCFEEKEQQIRDWFESNEDEFLKYERIPDPDKPTGRTDLNAFIKLDKLVPGNSDIVCAAEHDEIFLGVELRDLARIDVNEADVIYLIRYGVRIGEFGLCMFV